MGGGRPLHELFSVCVNAGKRKNAWGVWAIPFQNLYRPMLLKTRFPFRSEPIIAWCCDSLLLFYVAGFGQSGD